MFYNINDCDIASCSDDNTPYASSSKFRRNNKQTRGSTNNLFQWFKNNHMKANADKCHVLFTGKNDVSANINEFEIESSKKEKLVSISIDTRLSFKHHSTSIWKRRQSKIACTCKNNPLHGFRKTKILYGSIRYISSLNLDVSQQSGINKIHDERAVYQNKNLSFSELLELDNAVTIHQRNL